MYRRMEYQFYNEKIKNEKNIAVLSNCNFDCDTDKKKINEIILALKDINPTHIVIPGDLYADHGIIGNKEDKVSQFLKIITNIAPTYYVKGDIEEAKNIYNFTLLPYSIYENELKNFYLLCEKNITNDNKNYYIDEDLFIGGIRFKKEYYHLNELERYKYILTYYKKYLEKLSKIGGSKTFNILLCHDALIKDVLENMNFNFDLVITGNTTSKYKPGLYDINYRKLMISNSITKFNKKYLEKFHSSHIENIRILRK